MQLLQAEMPTHFLSGDDASGGGSDIVGDNGEVQHRSQEDGCESAVCSLATNFALLVFFYLRIRLLT